MVKFSKCVPRFYNQNSKNTGPEWYPAKDIERGYNALGHVKHIKTPIMKSLNNRGNKRYNLLLRHSNELRTSMGDASNKI